MDDGDEATSSTDLQEPDIDDVFRELDELAELVDSPEERQQVLQTMRTLRRSRRTRLVGRLRDTFDSRDVGEALVGSFVFGAPMIVEGGTQEIGVFLAPRPALLFLTIFFGGVLVFGILHAVGFERIEEDIVLGVIPIRLIVIPLIAAVMGFGLMTAWGRVDWMHPMVAFSQCTVTSLVMAVGASLGDVLPGT